jgi:hypothetical protein
MSRWPTEKHFTSWLTLAPHNKISGGRLLSSKTQPSANRAAAILRMAATNLGRTDTALGAFYRRLAYRVGKAKAITATARKLAILVYRTLKDGLVYQDPGAATYDAQHRVRVLHRLRQRAANLGFSLLNRATGELLEGAVSSEPGSAADLGDREPAQILRARMSEISVCRGIASSAPMAGLAQSECERPSRFRWQPCFLRWRSRLPRFTLRRPSPAAL